MRRASNIQQLVDMTWYTCEGLFDDEIVELATTELHKELDGDWRGGRIYF